MSERPWYKRYPANFIAGTLGLSLEEKGAYSLVLDLIYDRGGPIPDDAHYIAGVCGCSVRKWNTIKQKLIDRGKIFAENGFISNFRAEKEIIKTLKTSEKHAENGAKGGNKKAENRSKSNKNKGLALARLQHTRINQKPEDRYINSSLRSELNTGHSRNQTAQNRQAEFQREFDQTFWPEYPRKVKKPHALKAFVKARERFGLAEIMAGLQRYKDDKPPYADWRHPATWLNDEGWMDDYGPSGAVVPHQGQGPPYGGSSRRKSANTKLLEAIETLPQELKDAFDNRCLQ